MTTLPDRLLAFRDAAESTNDDEGNEGCATYVPVSLQIFRDAMDEAAAALSGGEAVGARRRTMTPTTSEREAVVERLRQTRADLGEHRQTHVIWRDWLQKDPANERVNPHAGSAEFHASTILDYDRHLANIDDALAALTREQREVFAADYVLPCDVAVAPATKVTKGCTLKTLMRSITLRENAETFEPGPEFRKLFEKPKQEAQGAVAHDVAMEGWHSAVDAAGELCTNAPDERYRTRAESVRQWIVRNKPTTPPAPVDVRKLRELAMEWQLPPDPEQYYSEFELTRLEQRRQDGRTLYDMLALLDGQPAVDDAMVIRACNAYFDNLPVHGGEVADPEAMRAALQAALGGGGGGDGC